MNTDTRLARIAATLALAGLLAGCTVYREVRTDGTRISAWNIGTGKRTFVSHQLAIAHSELPETLKAAEGLAGKLVEGAVIGAKGGL